MQVESSYVEHLFECEGMPYNLQHQPHRITHANQFSDPYVRQNARRPNQNQRFDVADPVPH